jgi:hypothetical protein
MYRRLDELKMLASLGSAVAKSKFTEFKLAKCFNALMMCVFTAADDTLPERLR